MLIILGLLLVCATVTAPVSAIQERFTNPYFDNGNSGWAFEYIDPCGDGGSDGLNVADGIATIYIHTKLITSLDDPYAQISQNNIDLTDVNEIIVRCKSLQGTSYTDTTNTPRNLILKPMLAVYRYDGSTDIRIGELRDIQTSGFENYAFNVADISGVQNAVKIRIYFDRSSASGEPNLMIYGGAQIDSVHASAAIDPPVVTSINPPAGIHNIIEAGSTINFDVNYLPNDGGFIELQFGDGTTPYKSEWLDSNSQNPLVIPHTYNSIGVYHANAYGYIRDGAITTPSVSSTRPVYVVSLSITSSAQVVAPNTDVVFTAQTGGQIDALIWDFGDGTNTVRTTERQVTHRYTTGGVHNVTCKAVVDNTESDITKTTTVTVGVNSLSWSQSSYNVGDTAIINYGILTPDWAMFSYKIKIYSGNGQLVKTLPINEPIDPASGSKSWDTNGMEGGTYTAQLWKESNQYGSSNLASATCELVKYYSLTINIAAGGATWAQPTQVTIINTQTDEIVFSQNVSTGQTNTSLPSGNYKVTAATMGYTEQSAIVSMTENQVVNIDFIMGTTVGAQGVGGAGAQYPSTFITFRVLDSITGKPIHGALVRVVGERSTAPLNWFSALFGGSWGNQEIVGTTLSGLTDNEGKITFSMFQTVKYSLTVTYGTASVNEEYFVPAIAGEKIIRLAVKAIDINRAYEDVKIGVTGTNGIITINYDDKTHTTQNVNVKVYRVETGAFWSDEEDDTEVLVGEQTFNAYTYSTDISVGRQYAAKQYKVVVEYNTGKYGVLTRIIGVSFPGPRVDIGIPDNLYILLCIGILLMLGGIGTILTAPAFGFLVVVIAWIMFAFGWLFAIGDAASWILAVATVFAIAMYMASRRRGM